MVLFDISEDSESRCELNHNGGYSLFCSPELEEMVNHAAVGVLNKERFTDSTPSVLEAQYLRDSHQVRVLDDSQRSRED
jgi:hypothetical protein